MRVPLGVLFLAVLALFAGIVALLEGTIFLGYIVFGPIPTGDGRTVAGILTVIGGVIWIAVGVAIFSLRPWAWMFGVLIALFGLFESLVTLLLTLSWEYAIATAVLPAVVLWYLSRDKVKEAFGVQGQLV